MDLMFNIECTIMNEQWKLLWTLLASANDDLNKFLSTNLPTTTTKNIKKFLQTFEKMKEAAEKVDDMMTTPIDAIEVISPWEDEKFKEAWIFWKEYRLESFGKRYKSREEKKVLEYLKDISGNDMKKAMKCLDFAMAGGYPRFFKVDEKQFNKPSKRDNNEADSDFD